MRAVTIKDGKLSVEDHPDPTPGAPQDIPGLELAGEVIERGDGANRFEVGDRVMGIVAGGGQAELAVVHERILMPVPENLSWTEAGGVPEEMPESFGMQILYPVMP